MTAKEQIRTSIDEAKTETGQLAWGDAARQRWIGYVAAMSQAGLLETKEAFELLREDLGATADELEYSVYLQETDVEQATDIVRVSTAIAA